MVIWCRYSEQTPWLVTCSYSLLMPTVTIHGSSRATILLCNMCVQCNRIVIRTATNAVVFCSGLEPVSYTHIRHVHVIGNGAMETKPCIYFIGPYVIPHKYLFLNHPCYTWCFTKTPQKQWYTVRYLNMIQQIPWADILWQWYVRPRVLWLATGEVGRVLKFSWPGWLNRMRVFSELLVLLAEQPRVRFCVVSGAKLWRCLYRAFKYLVGQTLVVQGNWLISNLCWPLLLTHICDTRGDELKHNYGHQTGWKNKLSISDTYLGWFQTWLWIIHDFYKAITSLGPEFNSIEIKHFVSLS